MARKLLGANAKSYRLKLKLKLSRLVSTSTDCPPASTGWQPPSTALSPTSASASLGGGPSVAGALGRCCSVATGYSAQLMTHDDVQLMIRDAVSITCMA